MTGLRRDATRCDHLLSLGPEADVPSKREGTRRDDATWTSLGHRRFCYE
mgnify:CR=1 FL=1